MHDIRDMPIAFDINDLLAYSDWERSQWHAWFRENGPATLTVGLGPHTSGRIDNIGKLVAHIFSAEQRYTERSRQLPLTDPATIPDADIEQIFAFGIKSRASMRELLASFSDWTAPREFVLGPNNTRIVNSRKRSEERRVGKGGSNR